MRAGRSPASIGDAKQRADQATLNFISTSEAPVPATAVHAVVRVNWLTADNVRMGTLSSIAGFVDAAGFATLVGLFPAHVTGELVGAAVALSSGHLSDELHRLVIIPIFVVAVVVGALVSRACRVRARSPLVPLLAMMMLLLAFFGLTDFLLPGLSLRPGLETALREGSVVAAMALQNVMMRQVLSTSYPTTVMTGNLTQFIIELVELTIGAVFRSKDDRPRARQKADIRLRLVGMTLGLFLGSAVLGGFLTAWFGSVSVLVPALAVGVLAIAESRRKTPVSRMGTLF